VPSILTYLRMIVLGAFLGLAGPGLASEAVNASLLPPAQAPVPGQALTLTLRLEHAPGWHTYYKDPGDAGLPTELAWDLPSGVLAGPIQWPKPISFSDPSGLKAQGYAGVALLPVALSIDKGFKEPVLRIKAKATWLACEKVCIPGSASFALELPLSSGGGAVQASNKSIENQKQAEPMSLGRLALFAFLGGLLLNLMPCVLPVLSLKMLSLVRQALGLAYSLGVLASFWALAAVVLLLKAAGNSVGWGFQMQDPRYVALMSALMAAFAVNLFGAFEFSLPGQAGSGMAKAASREGLAGAFISGIFATALATPCTAPFLGAAAGFAFSQGPQVLLLSFTATGLGLALPFALVAFLPGLRSLLPKPGNWMLVFKQAMGFLLLAFMPWLWWVLGRQVGLQAALTAASYSLLIAFVLWLMGHAAGPLASWGRAFLAWSLALSIAVIAWHYGVSPALKAPLAGASGSSSPMEAGWVAYDSAQLQQLRRQNRLVFVDATADWCWTCKVNERTVLQRQELKQAFTAAGVVLMKADWTRSDKAVTDWLRSFDRAGVPFYAIYPGEAQPITLPEVLTLSMVMNAIDQAKLALPH
jgi:thiol:disulfide interchange protein